MSNDTEVKIADYDDLALSSLVASYAGWKANVVGADQWSLESPTGSSNALKTYGRYVVLPISEGINQFIIPHYAQNEHAMLDVLHWAAIKHSFRWSLSEIPHQSKFQIRIEPFEPRRPEKPVPYFFYKEGSVLARIMAEVFCNVMRDKRKSNV